MTAPNVIQKSAIFSLTPRFLVQKQSEEDDLKKVLCAQSVERVRRDNVHERFSNTRNFAGIVGGGGFHDEAGTYLHYIAEHKADRDCNCGTQL